MKKNKTFFLLCIISVENKNNITGVKANCGWTFHFFTVATFSKYLLYTVKSCRLKKLNWIREFFCFLITKKKGKNKQSSEIEKIYMGCGFRLEKQQQSMRVDERNQTNSFRWRKKIHNCEKILLFCF